MTMHNFFYPEKIAVIGVSPSRKNLARNILYNLNKFGYSGEIFAIGPKKSKIFEKKIYQSVLEIKSHLDLAIILVPARFVASIMDECGRKGIKSIIICTGGFSEFGSEGNQMQNEVDRTARKYKMKFIGPNCLGVINLENNFVAPFTRLKRLKAGNISVMSQSGGVGLSSLSHSVNENAGLNKFISFGNKANLDEVDFIDYLNKDKNTKIICMFLENIRRGREFIKVMQKIKKPVIIYKGNISESGAKIAKSHTAALKNDENIINALVKQLNLIRATNMLDMMRLAKTLLLPPMKGERVACIARTGGYGVIAADACELYGLKLPPLSESILRKLEKILKKGVIDFTNPLDLGVVFDIDVYLNVIEEIFKDKNYDAIFLHILNNAMMTSQYLERFGVKRFTDDVLKEIENFSKKYQKPLMLSVTGETREIDYFKKHLNLPIFNSPEEAIRSLAIKMNYEKKSVRERGIPETKIDRKRIKDLIEQAKNKKLVNLGAVSLEIIRSCGIPVAKSNLIRTEKDLAKRVVRMYFPLVLKTASPSIIHKSDLGLVKINLENMTHLKQAYLDIKNKLRNNFPGEENSHLLLQEMIKGGREVILGMARDEYFGPVVMFGLGGLYVEILKDVTFRIIPITRDDAMEMIYEIKSLPLLLGARGEEPSDIKALVETLLSISHLGYNFDKIKEVDINPLIVFSQGKGCMAVDARIIIE